MIIAKVDESDKTARDEILSIYYESVQGLTLEVIDIYLKSEDIPKPKIKGFMDLVGADIKNLKLEEQYDLFFNTILASVESDFVKKGIEEALNLFHKEFLTQAFQNISKDDKQKIHEHINGIKQRVEKVMSSIPEEDENK